VCRGTQGQQHTPVTGGWAARKKCCDAEGTHPHCNTKPNSLHKHLLRCRETESPHCFVLKPFGLLDEEIRSRQRGKSGILSNHLMKRGQTGEIKLAQTSRPAISAKAARIGLSLSLSLSHTHLHLVRQTLHRLLRHFLVACGDESRGIERFSGAVYLQGGSATFRAQGALDKRRWSRPRTMRASGS